VKVSQIISFINGFIVFFMIKGLGSYVLQSYENYSYITVEDGDVFGHVDIALHKRALELEILKDREYSNSIPEFKDQLSSEQRGPNRKLMFKRVFSVQSLIFSQCVSLSIERLEQMRNEFPEEWTELMVNAYQRFSIESQLKIAALKHCAQLYN
jgi:hypothetical protein